MSKSKTEDNSKLTFTEKLRRLTEGRNKGQIARGAGLSPTSIADYLQKRYTPRADTALKLARVLEVPLDWLVDDERQDWPPPHTNHDGTGILGQSISAFLDSIDRKAARSARRDLGDHTNDEIMRAADLLIRAHGEMDSSDNVLMGAPQALKDQHARIVEQLEALTHEIVALWAAYQMSDMCPAMPVERLKS